MRALACERSKADSFADLENEPPQVIPAVWSGVQFCNRFLLVQLANAASFVGLLLRLDLGCLFIIVDCHYIWSRFGCLVPYVPTVGIAILASDKRLDGPKAAALLGISEVLCGAS